MKENNPEYIKEYFFYALECQHQGAASADKHKWQLRLGWAVLSAAFLGACATSQDFRCLQFTRWLPPLLTSFLFFFLFFFYDCHLTHLSNARTNRVKQIRQQIAQSPSKLPVDLLLQDIRKDYMKRPRWQRPWVKLGVGITALDFWLFYSFTLSFWIVGWLIKFGIFTEKC